MTIHALVPPASLPGDVARLLSGFAVRQGWPIGEGLGTEDQLGSALRAQWRASEDELLGLGHERLPRGSFRLLCFGLLGAADLGEAIGRAESFRGALPALSFQVERDQEAGRVAIVVPSRSTGVDDPDLVIPTVGLVVVHRLLSWAVHGPVPGARIELPGPRRLSPGTTEALFGGIRVVFGARRAVVAFDHSAMAMPMARSSADVDVLVEGAPLTLLRDPEPDPQMAPRVRQLMLGDPPGGSWLSAQAVARRLCISEQTLRRRLQVEGTSFRSIVEEVRREAAMASLARGEESIAALALRLGYSEASAFTRAFHRWTGATPGAFRQEA
ncbi:AraC family transcriptional regulator [Nocardioides stalactiti]|uniref:AraC family transcriptional regulator n=1 Tax=Nocardioides stalactiti TaxID=2755356 RepID=UPI0016046D8E|nr:AraC family transcriptional regulator [Nocardioides stalactiti]